MRCLCFYIYAVTCLFQRGGCCWNESDYVRWSKSLSALTFNLLQMDGQACRQASALAAASTCWTAFWEDGEPEKGGFKLKVAAAAALRHCFFQWEVRGRRSLQVLVSLRFFSELKSRTAAVRRHVSPPTGFPPHPFYFSLPPSHYGPESRRALDNFLSCRVSLQLIQRLTVTRLRRYKFNAGTRVVHLQRLAARCDTRQPVITQLPLLLGLAEVNILPRLLTRHCLLLPLNLLTQKQSFVFLHCKNIIMHVEKYTRKRRRRSLKTQKHLLELLITTGTVNKAFYIRRLYWGFWLKLWMFVRNVIFSGSNCPKQTGTITTWESQH